MAVEKIRLGTNEDGTPHYLYRGDHLVYTGPNVSGHVQLADGSTVDVTELFVEAADPEHALAISDAIGKHFESSGHPAHRRDGEEAEAFVHTPASLSHRGGKPSGAFAAAVDALAPRGSDSSPQAVIDHLKKKG